MAFERLLDRVVDSRWKSRLYICACWAMGILAEVVLLLAFRGEPWVRPVGVAVLFGLPMLLMTPLVQRLHGLNVWGSTPEWVRRFSRWLSASWWRVVAWAVVVAALALAVERGLRLL